MVLVSGCVSRFFFVWVLTCVYGRAAERCGLQGAAGPGSHSSAGWGPVARPVGGSGRRQGAGGNVVPSPEPGGGGLRQAPAGWGEPRSGRGSAGGALETSVPWVWPRGAPPPPARGVPVLAESGTPPRLPTRLC